MTNCHIFVWRWTNAPIYEILPYFHADQIFNQIILQISSKTEIAYFQKAIIKLIFIFYGKYQVQENVYLKTTLNTSSQMLKLVLKGLHRFRLIICLIFWNFQNHIFMENMIRIKIILWVKWDLLLRFNFLRHPRKHILS